MNGDSRSALEAQYIRRHHKHEPRENQCTSALVKHIKAPVHLVSLPFPPYLVPCSMFHRLCSKFSVFGWWVWFAWWGCHEFLSFFFFLFIFWRSVRLCLFWGVSFEFLILYTYLGVFTMAFLFCFLSFFLKMGGLLAVLDFEFCRCCQSWIFHLWWRCWFFCWVLTRF